VSPSTPLSYLFVPGNRPERFAKALASGADRIIIDLEDAVAPADKAAARAALAQWMLAHPEHAEQVLIRINDAATPWYADDMAMAQAVQALCIMLPKCEAPGQVADVLAHLPATTSASATVLPLIETARGLLAVQAIATAPSVNRLAFGSLDYMADLDLPAHSVALDYAAAHIAIASRAAGLPSPLAGVTPELDTERVSADMLAAKALGFGAKMCIHPAQVAAVHTALAPSAQELAWAQRVLQAWAASAGGAIQLDGKMVDRPVVLKAERITAQAARTL
jgi:citrate lyase subunit beta / citryl-CoA lyase